MLKWKSFTEHNSPKARVITGDVWASEKALELIQTFGNVHQIQSIFNQLTRVFWVCSNGSGSNGSSFKMQP